MESVSISDLQSCTYRADRCIAVQKPPEQGWRDSATITLVRGSATSDETTAVALAVWQRLGKQVAVVNEPDPAHT
jgi:3-hydroxyacyl-CoA dehydrogenase